MSQKMSMTDNGSLTLEKISQKKIQPVQAISRQTKSVRIMFKKNAWWWYIYTINNITTIHIYIHIYIYICIYVQKNHVCIQSPTGRFCWLVVSHLFHLAWELINLLRASTLMGWSWLHPRVTLQGINISHLGKRKIIFKMPFLGFVSSLEGSPFQWDFTQMFPTKNLKKKSKHIPIVSPII